MKDKPKQQPSIEDRFHYHAPSQVGVGRHAALSDALTGVATLIEDLTLDCRERAVALTKLEEAKFWASAAVARYEETR